MEGVMENWTNAKLCDVANLILALFCSFRPGCSDLTPEGLWKRQYRRYRHRALAIAALTAFAIWEEWLNSS